MDDNDYINSLSKLQKARAEYLGKTAKLPFMCTNYYIFGEGGTGKDTLSKLLAHALMPEIDNIDDVIFMAGGSNVSFDGYDGQPIIIWSDFRAWDFFDRFGRSETYKLLDTHPRNRGSINIKYGKTKLINSINIINGIQPYMDFINQLAGEYTDKRTGELHKAEDKKQPLRRFPIIAETSEQYIKILINKGFFYDTTEYYQYLEYSHYIGNSAYAVKSLPEPELIDFAQPITNSLVKLGEEAKNKNAQFKENQTLPPALIETYCHLAELHIKSKDQL